MEHNLRVCERCLMAIESREGRQYTKIVYVGDYDENDENDQTRCEWCEENGFDILHEFI